MTRILCLDDDPGVLDLLRLILTRAGYEVIDTTNSYEALVSCVISRSTCSRRTSCGRI